jgi:hypothetical protein
MALSRERVQLHTQKDGLGLWIEDVATGAKVFVLWADLVDLIEALQYTKNQIAPKS